MKFVLKKVYFCEISVAYVHLIRVLIVVEVGNLHQLRVRLDCYKCVRSTVQWTLLISTLLCQVQNLKTLKSLDVTVKL